MHRRQILELLENYQTRFMEEAAYVSKAINFIRANPDSFERELATHVTGSAWVINQTGDQVLMMHHKKLEQWFQPGGHADGDADILRVAIRETLEETGLPEDKLHLVSEQIFDVDIHSVDATEKAQSHEHIDVRFLIQVDDRHPVPGNDESHDVARFNNNLSTYRMVEKTRRLAFV